MFLLSSIWQFAITGCKKCDHQGCNAQKKQLSKLSQILLKPKGKFVSSTNGCRTAKKKVRKCQMRQCLLIWCASLCLKLDGFELFVTMWITEIDYVSQSIVYGMSQ
jgi:hypothetical protein